MRIISGSAANISPQNIRRTHVPGAAVWSVPIVTDTLVRARPLLSGLCLGEVEVFVSYA